MKNVASWLSEESITSHTLVVCTANLYGACSEYCSPSVVHPIKLRLASYVISSFSEAKTSTTKKLKQVGVWNLYLLLLNIANTTI